MINGIIAPPTIEEIITADPSSAKCPNPLIPKAKMAGNNIELKKPTDTIETTAILPVEKIETSVKKQAAPANPAITLRGDKSRIINPPISLPIMALPQ